jgi:hypothetical protein
MLRKHWKNINLNGNDSRKISQKLFMVYNQLFLIRKMFRYGRPIRYLLRALKHY